jgi:hypothetical protein
MPIDDPAVVRLYQERVAAAGENAMERIGAAMQRLMRRMAQSASQGGNRARALCAQLSGLDNALASKDVEQWTRWLTAVLACTAEMKSSVEALHHNACSSEDEIKRLRGIWNAPAARPCSTR